MADYADIYGKRVKVFDSDPTLDSSYEGQVWYNSATGTLKSVINFGSWNSEANCSETSRGRSSAGSFPACVYVGGFTGSFPITTQSEEFNGFTFSNGGSTNTANKEYTRTITFGSIPRTGTVYVRVGWKNTGGVDPGDTGGGTTGTRMFKYLYLT